MDGIGWAAAAMDGARTRLEAAAVNLANASSDGFKGVRLRGRIVPDGLQFAHLRDGAQGALRPTGRDLDVALAGRGWFAVRNDLGKHVPSRGGALQRDKYGRVCDVAGRIVLGRNGALRFPGGARLEPDGDVTLNGTVIDRLQLTPGTTVRTGFLESANVDAIGEMVDLLGAQRSFETAEKTLSAIDQTRERDVTQTALVRA
jgi:flagellar basal body rod protein FlgG